MATTKDEVVIELVAQTQKALGGIKKVGLAVGAVIAAVKSFETIARNTFDNIMLANQLDDQSIAFDQLAKSAGVASDDVLNAMQEMTFGTISRLDLMRTASQANLLGIGFTEMPKLLEIARASAVATGQDMSFMFDSIVTGIGRGSPLILDNLGIMVKLGTAYENHAEILGKTVDELTDNERKQAILNETLVAGEDIINKVGTAVEGMTRTEKIAEFKVAIVELKTELGEGLAPILDENIGLITKLINTVTERVGETNQLASAMKVVEKMQTDEGRRGLSVLEVDKARKVIAEELARSEEKVLKFREHYGDIQSVGMLGADPLFNATLATVKALEDGGLKNFQDYINLLNDQYGILLKSGEVQEKQISDLSKIVEGEEEQNKSLETTLGLLNGIKTTFGTLLGALLPEGFRNTFIFDEPTVNEQYWQDIEDRYNWAEKAEINLQRLRFDLAKIAHDEAVRQAEELKQKIEDITQAVSVDGVNAFHSMGVAISQGKDATVAFADAILGSIADAMRLLAVEIAIAGAKQIGMGNVPLGLGMLLAAAGLGIFGGALSGISSSASGSSPASASSTLSTSSQNRSQPNRSIIINNTTVSGSYIASRNFGMKVT